MKSFPSLLVIAAVCGMSNGFVPQSIPTAPRLLSIATPSPPPSLSSTSLNVWNLFTKEDPVVEVVKEDPQPGPLETQNYVAGAVWIALLTFAFAFAPGSTDSAADAELLNTLIAQPYPRPEGINELWFAVWNCFTVVPALLAALEAPVGRGQRLPAAPFLFGSAFLGYFSLGPYFATRTPRTDPVDLGDLGWPSRNIFENRLFGVFLSAITISIPFSSGLFECDLPATFSGLMELASSSRFVSVAFTDITIMSLLAAVLVSEDAKRRGWEDKAVPLLAASILLPVITPSLYLAARPSLEK
mmetsp:Transcript_120/g.262  ORF Transcript_120/g.262 Transcript_120/m.262 type:complete len:300 (-) Transcript_120:224-1123(-)